MARVKAFRGLVPRPDIVEKVACVPYDVVNRAEAAELAAGLPESLMHVDRAEIDLPETVNPYDDAVYAQAKKAFGHMISTGIFQREEKPCLYLYRQRMGKYEQTGLVGVCPVEDYENDIIRKHEKTRKDKEDDRTRLIATISANTGPVFLTYREDTEIDAAVARECTATPLYDFTAVDGIAHTVWRVKDAAFFEKAFERIPLLYVADGHHRSASAARVGRERRAANPAHTGNEDYNSFLCVLFPGNQLRILPYNRVVYNLNGHTPESFLSEVRKIFTVTENAAPEPTAPHNASCYLAGRWYGLSWPEPEKEQPVAAPDPVSRLDVSVLQDRLLAPVLGIDDPRTSKRIDFVGGIRGTGELVRRVDSGECAVAFSMFPTTVEQLMAIADAGQIMPPKSTWFEPKLRSGLFVHIF